MGTRSLTCVYYEGRYQIVQPARFDGYPAFEGISILYFLRKEGNQRKLKEALDNSMIYQVTHDHAAMLRRRHHPDHWNRRGTAASTPYQEFPFRYPTLHECLGSIVLKIIATATEPVPVCLEDVYNSAVDWIYVADFDKGTFEVFGTWDVAERRGKSVRNNKRFLREEVLEENSPVALWHLHDLPRTDVFEAYFGRDYD